MAKTDTEDQDQAYHPNQLTGVVGPSCYRDQLRVCGPDCMAFLPQAPEGDTYKGEQWAHCQLLVNNDRMGRHLVILVSLLQKDVSLRGQAHAASVRSQKAPGVV